LSWFLQCGGERRAKTTPTLRPTAYGTCAGWQNTALPRQNAAQHLSPIAADPSKGGFSPRGVGRGAH